MSGEDKIQVFIKGISASQSTIHIDKNATIAQLFQEFSEHIGIPGSFGLVYGGEHMRKTNPYGKVMFLKDYGIEDESHIGAVLRLPGGSVGFEKLYGPKVKLSSRPDMLGMDDQAVDMPCGHAMGPNSMTSYVKQQLQENRYQICCPDIVDNTKNEICNQPWGFKKVKKAAILTKVERTEIEGKISDNYIKFAMKSKECPKCKSYCVRENKANPRVVCIYCSSKSRERYEFCWICLRQWKTSGTSSCGNNNCENVNIVSLGECKTKTVVGVPNCPSMRGCPHCGILIEHIADCKHMTCGCCKESFCFICLKVPDNGAWKCGSYNTPCLVAPRQTILPA